jgi:hypothetical protein
MVEDGRSPDYFTLAHNNNSIASDVSKILRYVATFKHALLFNPRILLADHMIVNSPAFGWRI